jgi:hypothetical protein
MAQRKTPNRVNDRLKRKTVKLVFLYNVLKLQVNECLKYETLQEVVSVTTDIVHAIMDNVILREHYDKNTFKDSNFHTNAFKAFGLAYIAKNLNGDLNTSLMKGPRLEFKYIPEDMDEFRNDPLFNMYVMQFYEEAPSLYQYLGAEE